GVLHRGKSTAADAEDHAGVPGNQARECGLVILVSEAAKQFPVADVGAFEDGLEDSLECRGAHPHDILLVLAEPPIMSCAQVSPRASPIPIDNPEIIEPAPLSGRQD